MANIKDQSREQFMLFGPLAKRGYDWWWHSFTAHHERTGEEKAFFLEFFTCNPAKGGKEPTFGRKGQTPSYLMVKCGTWGHDASQLHRFFGWEAVELSKGVPFSVSAGDCTLNGSHSSGSVTVSPSDAEAHPEWMSDSGEMRWDLQIDKQIAFHVGYGASRFFRKLNSFEMFWHAEGMKTAYSGWVEWNGEKYLVRPEDCYGYADKNWGGDFTSPWVWLSSNHLVSKKGGKQLKNSVFDIGGGRPKAFGIALNRKLLSDFWYEGRDFEFNFSKFWTFTRTKFQCRETDTQMIWHIDQENLRNRMVTDIVCEKSEMLLVNYESPDGRKRHNRLWNGGTGYGTVKLYRKRRGSYLIIDVLEARNVGCEYGEYGNEAVAQRAKR